MTESPDRIESLFAAAVEFASPEERAAYLGQVCAGDHALREQLEALLQAHDRCGHFLDRSVAKPAVFEETGNYVPLSERVGTLVAGRYKLLEQIGEGGMGLVYMAEQQQPVRRNVALKIIKPGLDSKQVIARFEAERQALALMDHQNIAKVLDAGTTETGRPFFVMELVHGVPITQFCDANQLTTQERLQLFVPVCQAIQHAHQKGIIHRDIKPSNVLVTMYDDKPVPKVIDFGVAKAIEQRLTEKTLFTQFGALVGTFEYMSPEQAQMNAFGVDTRSDIYSLGVLLYELLTGTTPLERARLRTAALSELVRLIKEEEPPRPSVRLSSSNTLPKIAAARRTEPTRLSKLVRGELDWIAIKCLEKDRSRRYETANGLARDIERYLHDEPVEACPPSLAYRVRKFARRNRMALVTATAALVVMLLVIAGLTFSTVLITREHHATTVALQAATEAKTNLEQALERERQNSYFQRIALAERELSANNLRLGEQLLDECPANMRGWEWHYLKRLEYKAIAPLHHESIVMCVAYSPTGECFASGCRDGAIKIWDAKSRTVLHPITAHEKRINGLAFSPDGQRLASGSSDTFIKIWNVRTGKILRSWEAHSGGVGAVAFSPDGKRLASAGTKRAAGPEQKEVAIWDAAAGKRLLGPSEHSLPQGGHQTVAFSPDGQLLAAGGDKEIKVWDSQTGDELHNLPVQSRVTDIAFSPDSRYLVSARGSWNTWEDGEVTIWDLRTEEGRTLRGHTGSLLKVVFSPDGRRIAAGGMDGTVKLWDVATGYEAITLRGHTDIIGGLAFSPDSRKLLSGSEDHDVRVWDATPLDEEALQGPLTLPHRAGVFGVAFDPGGGRLATACADGHVTVWNADTGKEELKLRGDSDCYWGVAYSPNGQQLAAGGNSGVLQVWDAASGHALCSLPGHAAFVYRVAFTPDGRLISAGLDTTVRILDAIKGSAIQIISAHKDTVLALAISPDGRYLVSASTDKTVKVWDAGTFQLVRTLEPPHVRRVSLGGVAFRPDGKQLATVSIDGIIKFWNTRTWKQERILRAPMEGVEGLAFSPDGRLLAGGCTDGRVLVWELASEKTRTLRGHTGRIQCIAFSPDGRQIASGSLDKTAKLWNVAAWPE